MTDDAARPARVAGLDWTKGLMLLVSVTVNSLLLTQDWFNHAAWEGVHGLDLVFPVFVTLTGCGLAFALHRRVRFWPLARRVVILLAVGLVYNAIVLNSFDPATWVYTGVLQLYAGVVLVLGLLHLVTRSWWGWLVITVVTAATYATVLALWANGCPDRELVPGCNPSATIDVAVFGAAHVYHQGEWGHDPVGLMALLGAVVSASAGATVGHLLLRLRAVRAPGRSVLPLLGAAGVFVALAVAAVVVPIWLGGAPPLVMKRMWTPPFALATAALAVLLLLLGHLVIDRQRVSRVTAALSWPLLALGRNSLLVYFGSHVLMSVLRHPQADGSNLADCIADALAIGGERQLPFTLALLALWVALACLLHRLGVYLRP
ncbi:heparan-alpha-glucosaminide N-acetyltransferase domain-containing protein [Herbiconiux sp. P18]|uniref:heparan-alpha-glucosaminide N-acetyltransferase domain-containing protein n=1 Tax=Herbiconiux liangxiaofengii TaxID=3342795 RepID=UPI0035B9ADDD